MSMDIETMARIILFETVDMDYHDYIEGFPNALAGMEQTLEQIEGTDLFYALQAICESHDDVMDTPFYKLLMDEIEEVAK